MDQELQGPFGLRATTRPVLVEPGRMNGARLEVVRSEGVDIVRRSRNAKPFVYYPLFQCVCPQPSEL